MQIVIVVLAARADGSERAGASTVTDILWSFADPLECLEHISGFNGHGTVSIVLFYLFDDPERASRRAFSLCRRAVSGSPGLRGWQVRSVAGRDIGEVGSGTQGS
jgi:hypothetical protein